MKYIIYLLVPLLIIACKEQNTNYTPAEAESPEAYNYTQDSSLLDNAETEDATPEVSDEYKYNSLETGATPYAAYYGKNTNCSGRGCSEIKVTTSGSDVLVLIKKNDKVVRHAYIQAHDSYTFSMPNGEYQTFFYSGRGWNPDKIIKEGELKGGFVSGEDYSKDEPQDLYNNILTYELILQQNGNFSTQPSDAEEIF